MRDETPIALADGEVDLGISRGRLTLSLVSSCFDSTFVYITPHEARALARRLLALAGRAASVGASSPKEGA